MKKSYPATRLMVLFDRDGRILAGVPVHDRYAGPVPVADNSGGRAVRPARGRAWPARPGDRRGPAVYDDESGHPPPGPDRSGCGRGLTSLPPPVCLLALSSSGLTSLIVSLVSRRRSNFYFLTCAYAQNT